MSEEKKTLARVNLFHEERTLAEHRENLREAVRLAHWHQVEIDLCTQRVKKLHAISCDMDEDCTCEDSDERSNEP